MKNFFISLILSVIPTYLLTKIILDFFPAGTFHGINSWLPHVICMELGFFFIIIVYTYLGIRRTLQNSLDGVKTATKDTIEDSLKAIEYKGKPFIYDIFKTNIYHRENKTGKQAREFINENDILSSFTHISILSRAPSILTSFGLGCTFLAILLGLKGIHVSVDQPVKGLDILINSLSSKFLTSLVALACAILLNFYSSWYFSKVHAAFFIIKNKIDELFPMESIGKIISENLTVDLDLKELRSGLSAACRETANAIDEQLNAFKQLISSGDLHNQISAGNNMIESLSKQIIQLQLNTQQSAQFLETIGNANKQLMEFSNKIDNLAFIIDTLKEISSMLQEDNKQLADNYNAIMKQLPEMTESFGEVCINMRNNLQNNYAEAIETAVIKGLEAPLQKITDNLQQVASLSQREDKSKLPNSLEAIQQPASSHPKVVIPRPPKPYIKAMPDRIDKNSTVSTGVKTQENRSSSSVNEDFEGNNPLPPTHANEQAKKDSLNFRRIKG